MAVKELNSVVIWCTLSLTVARTLAHCYVLGKGTDAVVISNYM